MKLAGNGSLDLSLHAGGLTIGSIEGKGVVQLGGNQPKAGSNSLDTTYNGVIDGPGSLVKIGHGQLTLGNANTYSGGTTVSNGRLLAANRTGSTTGSGPVQVDLGELGGRVR